MENVSLDHEETRKLRRLRLLQKGGLFTRGGIGVKSRRAATVAELREAYRVVHDVFVASGFISAKKSGLRIRPFETSRDTATFVSKVDDKVVGVFSLIMDSKDLKLPSDHVFGDQLDDLRRQGNSVCEMSNQAVMHEYRNSSVSTELMQCVFAQAWHSDATNLVCSISPTQRSFFEMIGFEQWGDIQNYSDEVDDPVAFMNLSDIQDRWTYEDANKGTINGFWNQFFISGNPFMAAVPFWNDQAGRLYQYMDNMVDLFRDCDELFEDATVAQMVAIEKRIGPAFGVICSGYNAGLADAL